MKRRMVFGVTAAALVAAFGGGALLYQNQKSQQAAGRISQNREALASAHSPSFGSTDAKVHIVEFLDPACGTCAAFYPQIKNIMRENPGRIRLSIRHVAFHSGAEHVVRVLEASRKQNKYWQTLEALLAAQDSWVSNHVVQPQFVRGAIERVGLDFDQLNADMNDPEVTQRIGRDRGDAQALGVKMTPEYFVNGRPLPSFGLPQLQSLVRDALRSAY